MLVKRMEKDRLVERIREKRDRRFVGVVATEKGKMLLDRATIIAWSLVQEILSVASEEELNSLNNILERIRQKAFNYSNPNEVMEKIHLNESRNMKEFMARIRLEKEKHPLSNPYQII
jgi:vacuolar-type H+-ATPase subunit H